MARRKTTKARALPPAVMKLHFIAEENSTNYIDIWGELSKVNRRFMRQGFNAAIANVKVTTLPGAPSGGSGASSYVSTMQHTWPVANSWVKAFHAWKNQQDEAIEEMGAESAVAAFRDFKVYLERNHKTVGNLACTSIGTPQHTAGPYSLGVIYNSVPVVAAEEWDYSEIVIPNDGAPGVTGEYTLHMLGPSSGSSKGIISGYEFSRSFPTSPDPSTPSIETSWLNQMQDVGDNSDEIVQNAQDRNAQLPYDQNEYPGGSSNFMETECQGYVLNQSSTGINTYNTGPFTAPCGLLKVEFANQTPTAPEQILRNVITITMVPGKHRGYLAETMEEF